MGRQKQLLTGMDTPAVRFCARITQKAEKSLLGLIQKSTSIMQPRSVDDDELCGFACKG